MWNAQCKCILLCYVSTLFVRTLDTCVLLHEQWSKVGRWIWEPFLFFFFFSGLGPPLDSEVFRTAPPGRPGSPSHVTATWLSGNEAALVCWEPSEVGQPFLSYTIEVLEVKTNVTKIWRMAADVVKEDLPNCTAGYTVSVWVHVHVHVRC